MVRCIIPVVMGADVLDIYGLITAVIINSKIHLSTAGLVVRLNSLATDLTIGFVGDASVRANAQKP